MIPLVAALLLAGCTPAPVPPGDPARPDLILVSIDTLRADHLSSYGYPRPTSPFMDELAARGLRWEHARAPSPWTLPSHLTLMSGWLPHHHGAVEDDIGIAPQVPLLAETVGGAGFTTAGFVATLYVSRKFGFERGFHHFDDGGIRDSKQNLKGEVDATDVVDAALAWLRRREAGEPCFLFLHFYDVHYAYDPPAPYDTLFDRAPREDDPTYRKYHHYLRHPLEPAQLEHQVAQYDEAIRYVDAELARLSEALRAAGREATWIVTSDHGEELGERGSWGHAHTLYPEQLRVPLIVSGARVPRTGVSAEVVGLQDLAPSVAAMVGASHPPGDGRPIALDPQAAPRPERAFVGDTSRFSTNRLGLWLDGWRLDLDLAEGATALFDTRADPGEQRDLSREQPERAAALEARLWQELGSPWEARGPVALRSRKGVLVSGGQRLGRAGTLAQGERFQVVPVDAELAVEDQQRWFDALHPPGPEAPFGWQGLEARGVELSAEERAQLEALGYIQGE
jgi:arylsulfatase A-like enzyme